MPYSYRKRNPVYRYFYISDVFASIFMDDDEDRFDLREYLKRK